MQDCSEAEANKTWDHIARQEQGPSKVQIGERCAMGGDTKNAMDVCGITSVAERTGAELCPFDNVEAAFDMYKIDLKIDSLAWTEI